ncbi:guanine nucleotide-binding protein alpha-2 subunit [Wolfiporia cocos MD-104 SS10]|uniref:Guanine nucleotide-binding protein alpha-2 subunit n=1 Tax=Wolfiporia cocos (strain MD-104) TaxID=742152 RepID=A0A2H3IT64_WOLCO|nr:guanine nucleotide-binding protein alpha-2 subunit [Wolfiporia cocos MD-104 SS10]
MLLLGTGDSGKTTLLKQMRLLFGVPFSGVEVELTRQIIFDNVVHGLRLLLRVMEDMALSVAPVNAECVDILAGVQDLKDYEPFPAWCYEPLKRLWEDPSVREARRRGGEVAVPDYLGYWFSDLERLFDPTYNPTYEDVLHAYTCTTGKAEMGFKLRKRHDVLLVDLGGQRSERKKWVHCFDGMSSVMFVVNLSSYDQPLVEATYANQMEDALLLWEAIYPSKWFRNTTIFLLFNKVDLFEEKIKYSHIKDYFSDYDGKVGDADAGKQYFLKKFMDAVHKDGEKGPVVRSFFVTATDTKMLRLVLGTVEGLVFHYE